MNILQLSSKSDTVGVAASTLCLIHCLATPFLFVAQAEIMQGGESHPLWWGFLDIAFLAVSFLAVLWSCKTTSKAWMRTVLWTSWIVLVLIIINEKLALFPLAEQAIYIPTLSLVFFHLYNRKYCQC